MISLSILYPKSHFSLVIELSGKDRHHCILVEMLSSHGRLELNFEYIWILDTMNHVLNSIQKIVGTGICSLQYI